MRRPIFWYNTIGILFCSIPILVTALVRYLLIGQALQVLYEVIGVYTGMWLGYQLRDLIQDFLNKDKADAEWQRQEETYNIPCNICGRYMCEAENCGGDCVYCMAESGDPECIKTCIKLAKQSTQ